MNPRVVVWGAALLAACLRFPGAIYPLGADESGFVLVAREWDPEPDNPYGTYWVDRPPILIALVKLADVLGGPMLLRVVAAAGCVLLVVTAAATARAALAYAGVTDRRLVDRTGAWTALLTAAFTSNAMIESVAAKGELLGIPFVMVSFLLMLRALARARVDAGAVGLAAASGLTAALAMGMKQNMVAGLVFGVVLLVGSLITQRITQAELLRLGAATAVGAVVPVAATIVWALAAGVRLDGLWYAVYGFRSDAISVIVNGESMAPLHRAGLLLATVLATGMAFVVAGALIHLPRLWRVDRTLTVAALVVVAVDVTGLVLGGSYWQAYLFILIPGMALLTTLLLAIRIHVARRVRVLTVLALVSSLVSSAVWAGLYVAHIESPEEERSGEAIAAASEPGDTIVVYGGRANIVLASGLESPYEHLWSLPMRTRDPDLSELREVLSGPEAPTWLVFWTSRTAWDGTGDEVLTPVVEDRYRRHATLCGGAWVYLRADLNRPPLEPHCDD